MFKDTRFVFKIAYFKIHNALPLGETIRKHTNNRYGKKCPGLSTHVRDVRKLNTLSCDLNMVLRHTF